MSNLLILIGVAALITPTVIRFLPKPPPPVPQDEKVLKATLESLSRIARSGANEFGAYQTWDGRVNAIKKMIKLAPKHPLTIAQLHWTIDNDWTDHAKSSAQDLLLNIL